MTGVRLPVARASHAPDLDPLDRIVPGRRNDLSVCLLTDSLDPSGVGEHMLVLAAGLRESCTVTFACPRGEAGDPFLKRAAALGLDTLPLPGDPGTDLACRRLSAWLGERRTDICHIHAGIGWEGIEASAAARAAGVPIVLRTEHLPYLLTEPAECDRYAAALGELDGIVCVSQASRDSFVAAGVPPSLLSVIRNGVPLPLSRSTRAEARARLGIDPQTPLLLTVARLTEQKGHWVLLDAVPPVLQKSPRARFLWAGAGELEQELREAIRERGLQASVALLGQRHDVPDLMAAADIFVLPSRFEGLPLAILESMTAGLPVVATRVCGTSEAVVHGETGLLVEPDDVDALASALESILAEPERAAQLARRGRRRVELRFSAARMVGETLALYRVLFAARGHARRGFACPLSAVETS